MLYDGYKNSLWYKYAIKGNTIDEMKITMDP